MLLNLLPKDFDFIDLFEKQVNCAVDASRLFKEIVAKGTVTEDQVSKMQSIERAGDDAAHTIIDHLNKTFITPFDREDIYSLVKEMDDITDMIYTIVRRLKVYKITTFRKDFPEFAVTIDDSVAAVANAVRGLNDTKNRTTVMDCCVEVNRLENVGDAMRDKSLGELLETEKDAIEVIKWKEIYQDAETVLDVCEDVAHIVESILVKQG
jgi:uncharacterized protein Yka (UPF0111/DUF47 family)